MTSAGYSLTYSLTYSSVYSLTSFSANRRPALASVDRALGTRGRRSRPARLGELNDRIVG